MSLYWEKGAENLVVVHEGATPCRRATASSSLACLAPPRRCLLLAWMYQELKSQIGRRGREEEMAGHEEEPVLAMAAVAGGLQSPRPCARRLDAWTALDAACSPSAASTPALVPPAAGIPPRRAAWIAPTPGVAPALDPPTEIGFRSRFLQARPKATEDLSRDATPHDPRERSAPTRCCNQEEAGRPKP
nr:unnamed protein product [Digitaria exilis]